MARRLAAEALGTALLLTAVIGSVILGERLADGNAAVAVLVNTIATGTVLGAVVQSFRTVSGGHINPVITLITALRRHLPWREATAYASVQLIGAFAGLGIMYAVCASTGVAVPHAITAEALVATSEPVRTAGAQLLGEFVATFGLVGVFLGCSRTRAAALPLALGAYTAAVYWFTASVSFANPAITLVYAAMHTIPPAHALVFIAAQLMGGASAAVLFSWLLRAPDTSGGTELRRDRKTWP